MNATSINYIYSHYLGVFRLHENQDVPNDDEFLKNTNKQKMFIDNLINKYVSSVDKNTEEKIHFCKQNKITVFLPVIN